MAVRITAAASAFCSPSILIGVNFGSAAEFKGRGHWRVVVVGQAELCMMVKAKSTGQVPIQRA